MLIDLQDRRFGRRFTDKAFASFHTACDAGDLDAADRILLELEEMFRIGGPQPATGDKNVQQALLRAQGRLWGLRCRSFGDFGYLALPELPSTLKTFALPFARVRSSLKDYLQRSKAALAA